MLQAVDVEVGGDEAVQEILQAADENKDGVLSFDEMAAMMSQHTFSQCEDGRYYVALSLTEAEHLRGILHLASGTL